MKIYFPLFLLVLFSAACSQEDLPEFQKLGTTLRVLGIKAEPPEVLPGGTVSITPLLSDLAGGGQSIRVVIEGCSDTGVSSGADPSCALATDRLSIYDNSINLSPPYYTQATPTATFTIPSSYINSRTAIEQYNGVAYLVTVSLTAANGTTTKSFKRVYVSGITKAKNTNPTITDLQVGGNSWTSYISGVGTVTPIYPNNIAESYLTMGGTGAVTGATELITTTWFSYPGSFSVTRTEGVSATNTFVGGTSTITGTSPLVVTVVRDDRGGEGFLIRTF